MTLSARIEAAARALKAAGAPRYDPDYRRMLRDADAARVLEGRYAVDDAAILSVIATLSQPGAPTRSERAEMIATLRAAIGGAP